MGYVSTPRERGFRTRGKLDGSTVPSRHCMTHRRHPRGHPADRVADPQRLHRFLEDDARASSPSSPTSMRDGRRVVGYGFNSNGRYGQGGLIRERFVPRLLEARPGDRWSTRPATTSTRTDLGDADDQREAGRPRRALGRGRHDRHGGLGRRRQDRGQAALPAARRALRRREADRRVFVYAAGGYYYPGKDDCALRARDAQLPRPRLHRREDEDRRRVARRGPAPHRGGARGDADGQAQLAVDANGRFDLETAIAYAKALRDYPLFWYEEAGDPLDYRAAGGARRATIPARWRPARTCSPCRTRAT